MKSTPQNGSLGTWAARYPIAFTNGSGETIPACAIMAITAVTNYGENTVYTVGKPAGTAGAKYLINAPQQVAYGQPGAATDFYPTDVAYTGGTPGLNEDWGPVSGSWLLSTSGQGWTILGGASGGIVRVAAAQTPGSETYRLLRAKTKGAVTAQATSFTIDNIIVEAGGLDPRTTPGDMAEELTVFKLQKEAFVDNTDVTVIYSPAVDTGIDWELLVVERFRALRGIYVSGTTALVIDNIKVLDSGRDPRTDPTSTSETVTFFNVHSDTYTAGDIVWADWNTSGNDGAGSWDARPKPGVSGGGSAAIGKADSTIAARSGSTAGSGTVSVWSISGTTLADTGTNETWYNISAATITSGVFLQAKEIDGQMVIDFEDCP